MPLTHRAVSVLASTAVLVTGFIGAAPPVPPVPNTPPATLPSSLPVPPVIPGAAGPLIQTPAPIVTLGLPTTPIIPIAPPPSPSETAPAMSSPAETVDHDPCSDAGPVLRYIVVLDTGATDPVAGDEITAACGTMTMFYPQIAVAVATSPDHHFADRLGRDRAYSAENEALTDRGVFTQHKHQSLEDAPAVRTLAGSGLSASELDAEQWDMAMIHADKAHEISLGSPAVVVGVLDSGVDASHPALRHAVDSTLSAGCTSGTPDPSPAAWAPKTSAHGTHIAGTIAASSDGRGVTGVAPGVRIAAVKIVDDAGFIYPEAAVCGFMWAAAHRFSVTNNSYTVDPWQFTCRFEPGQQVVHEAVRRAVNYAAKQGVLNIAAVGNEGLDLTDQTSDNSSPDNAATPKTRALDGSCDLLPGQLKGVVAVSSVGAQGLKASYSSYGLGVADVTAPGGDRSQRTAGAPNSCVLSTVPGGYGYSCGTSMAVPHVSGVAALLASKHPGASPAQLTRMLNAQADPLSCPGNYDLNGDGIQDAICNGYSSYNGFYGHGMVDALKAVSN